MKTVRGADPSAGGKALKLVVDFADRRLVEEVLKGGPAEQGLQLGLIDGQSVGAPLGQGVSSSYIAVAT